MAVRTLYEWFQSSVHRHGSAAALEVRGDVLSYRQLAVAAERLAGEFERVLGRAPTRVGLLCSRSVVSYAGYLAALRLGAAAVPLNPSSPVTRNLTITQHAGLDVVLVDDTAAEQLEAYAHQADPVIVDMSGDRWRQLTEQRYESAEPGPMLATPDSIAYIVYTSGSTGTPKGVPVAHANVSAYLDHVIERYEFGPDCRASQTFEVSFDGSVIELFASWGSGATICVPQKSEVLTPVRYVNDRRLTHWMSVPSVISFARRLSALPAGSMPTLRWSLFGGEPLTVEQAAAWGAAAPNATVENTYGPTELTCTCTGYSVRGERSAWAQTSNGSLPIGDIFPRLEYVLLDESGRPAQDGELCVRGPQRFPGYLDPAHNVGRFVSIEDGSARIYDGGEPLSPSHWYRTGDRIRRENGHLVHVGRIDDQVKIRGYRVELGEIESIVRRHPTVEEIVVVPVVAADGEPDLHAIYTGTPVVDAEFAALLADIPVYMRPRGFYHRPALPLNANGKVDRKRLAAELTAELAATAHGAGRGRS